MLFEDLRQLSAVRYEHASECLSAAKNLLKSGNYKSAANRAYYAVFHAMRAVLAYDEIDMKKHSGLIAEFRRLYIKTGVFNNQMSKIISELFDIRTESDYDDFFIISKEDVLVQIKMRNISSKPQNSFLTGSRKRPHGVLVRSLFVYLL